MAMSVFFRTIVNSVPMRITCNEIYFSKIQDKTLCVRWLKNADVPKPGMERNYRRIVHYTDKYTIKPLNVTNLAGRDPDTGKKYEIDLHNFIYRHNAYIVPSITGKIVVKGLGGGIKHKYHWIDWKRVGPKEGPPLVERVIQIMIDGCRTAHIALVGRDDKLRYILATENMKAGDLIKTSCEIPRIPGTIFFTKAII